MFTLEKSTRDLLVPVAGQRTSIELLNGKQTEFLNVTKRARINITSAVTAIRNRGSVQAIFTEEGILEQGEVKSLADPRALRHAAECATASPLTATRLASTGVGITQLVEHSRLYFAHPYAVNAKETNWLEHNPAMKLKYFLTLDPVANGLARLVDIGAGAAVVDQVQVTVQQGYDSQEGELPLYLPTFRQISIDVNQANTDLKMELQASAARLRGITISQITSDKGEVNGIINSYQLRGDRTFIVGPEKMPWDDAAREQEYEYGGDVYAGPKGAHVHLNFQRGGRLARTLDPMNQDMNLRFIFDCQPQAGAAGSKILITLHELQRDLFVDQVTGRRVVRPALPFTRAG